MNIRPVRVELFSALRAGRSDGRAKERIGGQTDMTKLIVALRNFGNGFKNQSVNAV